MTYKLWHTCSPCRGCGAEAPVPSECPTQYFDCPHCPGKVQAFATMEKREKGRCPRCGMWKQIDDVWPEVYDKCDACGADVRAFHDATIPPPFFEEFGEDAVQPYGTSICPRCGRLRGALSACELCGEPGFGAS